jgi:hypothetical protein
LASVGGPCEHRQDRIPVDPQESFGGPDRASLAQAVQHSYDFFGFEFRSSVRSEAPARKTPITVEAAINGIRRVVVSLVDLKRFALAMRAMDFHVGLLDFWRERPDNPFGSLVRVYSAPGIGPVGSCELLAGLLTGRPAQAGARTGLPKSSC